MTLTVISLGRGVQSWGLAAMSALGVLPPVDAAIHADTGHERTGTYAHAAKWTLWLEERGVRVVTVQGDKLRPDEHWGKTAGVRIPAFTSWASDQWVEIGDWIETEEDEIWMGTGEKRLAHRAGDPSGMLGRQCTRDWKLVPIKRWLQAHRSGDRVEQWIGITLDEVTRMGQSDVKYSTLVYPFIEMLDRPWTRGMVMRWLRENDLDIPVKSSCVFCPYRDNGTWREIKLAGNGDWQKALEADRAIRDHMPGYRAYLHRTRQPLADVDLRSEQDRGQLELWGEECTGHCFL